MGVHHARSSQPMSTLVLIGDDEFWLGELSGRRPVKRSYLAIIVRALDSESVNASVIALDFDLRLPKPNATVAKPFRRNAGRLPPGDATT